MKVAEAVCTIRLNCLLKSVAPLGQSGTAKRFANASNLGSSAFCEPDGQRESGSVRL